MVLEDIHVLTIGILVLISFFNISSNFIIGINFGADKEGMVSTSCIIGTVVVALILMLGFTFFGVITTPPANYYRPYEFDFLSTLTRVMLVAVIWVCSIFANLVGVALMRRICAAINEAKPN